MLAYKFEIVDDYVKSKVEVRKIESEFSSTKQEITTIKRNAMNKSEQKSEQTEVKELPQQINKRTDK